MNDPLVTILMPAYNCEAYVGDAIKAILDQTFSNYEFLIINDGSVDKTKEVILLFDDPRIRFIDLRDNGGIVSALNLGLSLAHTKYILRTDADDMALEHMVAHLVEFMEANPDYIICGGNMKLIDGDEKFNYPLENEDLKVYALGSCPFSHSTVIFRNDILKRHGLAYDETIKDGEDHGLWSSLIPFGKFKNLDEITLLYRQSDSQVTAQKRYSDNYVAARRIIFRRQGRNFFDLDEERADLYVTLILGLKIHNVKHLLNIGNLYLRVLRTNRQKLLFDQAKLNRFLFTKWHSLCVNSDIQNAAVFGVYSKYAILTKNVPRPGALKIILPKI
jgi:glycosyltransferase involved in cell wall biosynthesis